MGVVRALRRLGAERDRSQMAWSEFGPWAAMLTASGSTSASAETALRNAASWACINVLADAISRTPLDVVRYSSDGESRTPVKPVPVLIDRPSALSSADVWRYQMAHSMLTAGDAFGIVSNWSGMYPSQVEWVDPLCVQACVEYGRKRIKVDGVDHEMWSDGGDAVHIPGKYVRPGSPFGLSPIQYAARSIGTSLAAEDFSNSFFTDGAHPIWSFAADRDLTADEARDIKNAVEAAMRPGSREPLVHGSGLNPTKLSIDPNETQFIDLMRFQIEQACRFWGVPPSMVYAAVSGQNVTYANVTDADLAFLKHSLDGYLVRIENALTELLPRPQVVRANRDAVLRADVKTRHEIHDIRLKNRTTTVNEVRRLEDEKPFDDPEFNKPGIPGGPEKIPTTSVPPPMAQDAPTTPAPPGPIQGG